MFNKMSIVIREYIFTKAIRNKAMVLKNVTVMYKQI
jgi:hypothetical protein